MYESRKDFYFASTHWDREWYKTVDEFRYMLIPVLDKVIDTLQTNPAFKIFTLDGQTSVLEDYLTIRPEKREVLTKLIRDGRIIIGPWYTMPDEFLLSGESLIQNLLAGHRITSGYGAKPLKTAMSVIFSDILPIFPRFLTVSALTVPSSAVAATTVKSSVSLTGYPRTVPAY